MIARLSSAGNTGNPPFAHRAPARPSSKESIVSKFLKSRLAVLGLAAAMAFSAHAQNVTGAGSSFVYPVMTKWSADYRTAT